MSPSIDLSPATFGRLQAHAVPLVDTIESVINRMIDKFEKSASTDAGEEATGQAGARVFNPDAPPDLTHAKILGVWFDGEQLGRGKDNWNGLLYTAVTAAKTRAKSENDFKNSMVVNYKDGQKDDEGYRHLPGTGISVQGQDANGAWRAVRHIARHLKCPVSVRFAWREKDGAAFPGVTGQLSI